MATIHSLPTELIRHTLALAYPPGRRGSGRGLCLTAVVHSTWSGPSRSVMTEKLEFGGAEALSGGVFIESGLIGFSCRSLVLDSCPNEDVRAILAKARAGGIGALKIRQTEQVLPMRLFAFAGLKNVDKVELETYKDINWAEYCTCCCDINDYKLVSEVTEFEPWPTNLRHLSLDTDDLPLTLFKHSSHTLTSLNLALNTPAQFTQLARLAPLVSQIGTFTLSAVPDDLPSPFQLPPELGAFLAALPCLSSLSLTEMSPHRLEQLLAALPAGLRTLRTTLLTVDDEEARSGWHGPDSAKWVDDWVPALRRCAALPAVRGLGAWRMSVAEAYADEPGFEVYSREQFKDWVEGKEDWRLFRRELRQAGVKFVYVAD